MRIGIDMGGMSIKFGLVDYKNNMIAKTVIPTRLDLEPAELIQDMADAVKRLLGDHGFSLDGCRGIGIGSPGTIDAESGVILYSNNFGWEHVPIVEIIREALGNGSIPVGIANDADAAALGEVRAGAAAGSSNAVLLTLGTGVGGGVILNGRIFGGGMRGGCELGHSVIVYQGEPCTCGRKGCLEAYASASGLLRLARAKMQKYPDSMLAELCGGDPDQMNGKMPFDAAEAGDPAGRETVEEYMGYLACGITNVINTFRPQKVILGGGVAAQREKLTRPLQEMVDGMCFGGTHGEIASIVTSSLGNDAGIIGAANLVS